MADHRASLGRPYTTRRPVPTIQRYVRTQKERREHAEKLADHRQSLQDAIAKFQVVPLPTWSCTNRSAHSPLESL